MLYSSQIQFSRNIVLPITRLLRLIGGLIILASVLLAAGEFGMDQLSPSAPISVQELRTIPFTDLNPFGANFFLHMEVEKWKIDKTIQMAKAANIKWMKQHFPWEEIQLSPGPDGYWDTRLNRSTWEKFDYIVESAHEHGIEIIARLDRPPSWTRQDNRRPEAPPDDFETYAEFVYDFVTRYKGKIGYLQIWNEPNIYPEWGEQSPDPADYVELLRLASQRAREADENIVILSAPLAQTLEMSSRAMSDTAFLDEVYQLGGHEYFDILFANAYGFALPPEDPPDPGRLNFQRVLLLRQIMEKYGDHEKPIWFNEFGWNAAPADFPTERLLWARVDEVQQAEYTVRAIETAREQWPWAGVFAIWYFRQAGTILPDRAEYYFRAVDVGFTPRPLYNQISESANSLQDAGPGEYGAGGPAVSYSAGWSNRPSPIVEGQRVMVSDKAGESATFTFRGGGIIVRAIGEPGAGRVYATIDGQEANLLPHDREGRSLIDLGGSSQPEVVEIRAAIGLAPGTHVLRLSVADNGRPISLAGFSIMPLPAQNLFGYEPPVIGLLAGVIILAAGVLVGRFGGVNR